MPIVVVTQRQWQEIFAPRVQEERKRKVRGRGPIAHSLRRVGRAVQNRQGPGRKTKRTKNAGVAMLHENRLGVR